MREPNSNGRGKFFGQARSQSDVKTSTETVHKIKSVAELEDIVMRLRARDKKSS